jgi:hypothetical protein
MIPANPSSLITRGDILLDAWRQHLILAAVPLNKGHRHLSLFDGLAYSNIPRHYDTAWKAGMTRYAVFSARAKPRCFRAWPASPASIKMGLGTFF